MVELTSALRAPLWLQSSLLPVVQLHNRPIPVVGGSEITAVKLSLAAGGSERATKI
jgi:hypothetical protein